MKKILISLLLIFSVGFSQADYGRIDGAVVMQNYFIDLAEEDAFGTSGLGRIDGQLKFQNLFIDFLLWADTAATHLTPDSLTALFLAVTDSAFIDTLEFNFAYGGIISLSSGTAINEFSTDTGLGGDSDDAVPTEKAVKAYADAITAALHAAVTLNASATTGGLGLSTQEITFRAATNAQTGYMTDVLVGNIETNNDKITTQWTTTGNDIYYNTGDVGIGADNLYDLLHIAGSGTSHIRLSDTGAETDTEVNALIRIYRGLNTNSIGFLGFGSSINNHFTIKNEISGGNIILTTTSGKVSVTGDIELRGSAITMYHVADATLQYGMIAMVDDGTDMRFDANDVNGDEPIGIVTGVGATSQGSSYGIAILGMAHVVPEEGTNVTRGDIVHSSSTTAGYGEFDATLTMIEVDEQVGHTARAEDVTATISGSGGVNTGTEVITLGVNVAGLGWVVGDPVVYWNSGGATLGGLTDGWVYWLLSVNTVEVTISATKGGSIVDLTDDGDEDTQYLQRLPLVHIQLN